MILSTVPGSALPPLAVLACAMGPHEPGSDGYRITHRTGHALALATVSAMVRAGRSPEAVAAYVLSLGMIGASVSRSIENLAHPGTFAEAVFEILAG